MTKKLDQKKISELLNTFEEFVTDAISEGHADDVNSELEFIEVCFETFKKFMLDSIEEREKRTKHE